MIYHEGTKGTKDRKTVGLVVSHAVVGAAIKVHRHLGPGLLESIYEMALCRELWVRGFRVERQVSVPVCYKGVELGTKIRSDVLVNSSVVVEVKAVDRLAPIHRAQVLTHLKLTNYPVGLLINFNVELLKYGVRRILLG
jgi:GxxExxY protein